MKETIRKTVDVGSLPGVGKIRARLSFRSVVPDVVVAEPPDLSYDFSAAIAQVLGRPEAEWSTEGLAVSRSVPVRVLHEFYDGVLLYESMRLGILPNAFGALAAQRIVVKCLAGMSELMVKYRFYLGLADDNGEFKILTGKGNDLQLIGIQDPYDRLFWLSASSTQRKVREKYGPTTVVVKGRRELQVYNARGALRSVLGFRKCLEELIPQRNAPVRRFLDSVYTNVRIPEFHGCRLGDNVLFQLDRLVPGLIKSMNHLFANDLGMPWNRHPRKPFRLMLFRLAGTQPVSGAKVLVMKEDITFRLESAEKYY